MAVRPIVLAYSTVREVLNLAPEQEGQIRRTVTHLKHGRHVPLPAGTVRASHEDWDAAKAHPNMGGPPKGAFLFKRPVDVERETDGRGFAPSGIFALTCPYGAPGDRLWVKETWQALHVHIDPETGYGDDVTYAKQILPNDGGGYWHAVYAATDPAAYEHPQDRGFPWRSSTHMPQWASRITLEVTNVCVEPDEDDPWVWVLSVKRADQALKAGSAPPTLLHV